MLRNFAKSLLQLYWLMPLLLLTAINELCFDTFYTSSLADIFNNRTFSWFRELILLLLANLTQTSFGILSRYHEWVFLDLDFTLFFPSFITKQLRKGSKCEIAARHEDNDPICATQWHIRGKVPAFCCQLQTSRKTGSSEDNASTGRRAEGRDAT